MGGSGSTPIANVRNDYELVIRASKHLEMLLETHFFAPGGKQVGLHEKISAARVPGTNSPLNDPLVKKLRFLATQRNRLIHDQDCDRIPNRRGFVSAFTEADSELQPHVPAQGGGGCVVS